MTAVAFVPLDGHDTHDLALACVHLRITNASPSLIATLDSIIRRAQENRGQGRLHLASVDSDPPDAREAS